MLLSRAAGTLGARVMTNMVGAILQAKGLAREKDICLQHGRDKRKSMGCTISHLLLQWERDGVLSLGLVASAPYPSAHLLALVHVFSSSNSWNGDEVPISCLLLCSCLVGCC